MLVSTRRHPRYWRTQGNEPSNVDLYADESMLFDGQPTCFLSHRGEAKTDHGGLVQTMGAFQYRGKRLRFSAKLKTRDLKGKANLFFGIMDSQPAFILKDEMHNREITGDSDWVELFIVIDVPVEARYIKFGASIKEGSGSLWVADVAISEVTEDSPLTEYGDPAYGGDAKSAIFDFTGVASEKLELVHWNFHCSPSSVSSQFEHGLRKEDDRPSLWISSEAQLVAAQGEKSNAAGFFTQKFNCVQWRGRRVRFSADIKSRKVGDWCGLMMWVIGLESKVLAFTTMYDVALTGDNDWQKWSVVLDVSPVACRITVGATLQGNGEVFFSNLSFSEAEADDLPTDRVSKAKN